MKIQLNTDNHITGTEALTKYVNDVVEGTLGRFEDRITRVEVHLNDENSIKSGDDDIRCLIEVRPAGMQPVTASHKSGDVHSAIDEAAEKARRLLESTFGKQDNVKGRTSFGGDQKI